MRKRVWRSLKGSGSRQASRRAQILLKTKNWLVNDYKIVGILGSRRGAVEFMPLRF